MFMLNWMMSGDWIYYNHDDIALLPQGNLLR